LKCVPNPKKPPLGEWWPDYLDSNREAFAREAAGDGERRVPCQVERCSTADERIQSIKATPLNNEDLLPPLWGLDDDSWHCEDVDSIECYRQVSPKDRSDPLSLDIIIRSVEASRQERSSDILPVVHWPLIQETPV